MKDYFRIRWLLILFAAAIMGSGSVIRASIVFTDIEDVPLFMGALDYKYYHVDLNEDGIGDAIFRSSEGDFQVLNTPTSRIAGRPSTPPNIGNFAAAVHLDEPIKLTLGSPWSWNTGPSALIACVIPIGCLGYWGDNIDYIGVQFAINGNTHYGWVEVEVPFIGINGGYIRSYAYETEPGVQIIAGTVPEPTVAALVSLSIFFFVGLRRRHDV